MRDRLASETEEERAARLQQMSASQHHRLAAETGSEREARLQRNREGQRGQQSQLPLFEHVIRIPRGLGRTSRTAPAALHPLAHPSHSSSRSPHNAVHSPSVL